jgi:hypothetical protein
MGFELEVGRVINLSCEPGLSVSLYSGAQQGPANSNKYSTPSGNNFLSAMNCIKIVSQGVHLFILHYIPGNSYIKMSPLFPTSRQAYVRDYLLD